MQIKKIIVNELFGVFRHEIELKDGGITIVIGENGLGKTVILEMLNALFRKDYVYFESLEFGNIRIEFDDEVVWSISKNEKCLIINRNEGTRPYRVNFIRNDREALQMAIRIARDIPQLIRVERKIWRDRNTNEYMDYHEIIRNYKVPSLYEQQRFLDDEYTDNSEPKWFEERIKNIDIDLIKTQRLLLVEKHIDSLEMIKVVNKYSDELKKDINQKLSESAALSSELDRTYPQRLIKYIKSDEGKVNKNDILKKLNELEEKRKVLSKAGLLDIGDESDILNTNDVTSNTITDVLMQYVLDSFDKLKIFDDICEKIHLFLSIINKRFKHKQLYINKENGFNFKSTIIEDEEKMIIPVAKLSSGEQNELVLFYELIFKSKSNSLILIDEPEISLHITWQNHFIEDLKRISKINGIKVLIATHSPDIIGNNWDCKVTLRGVE